MHDTNVNPEALPTL